MISSEFASLASIASKAPLWKEETFTLYLEFFTVSLALAVSSRL